MTDAKHEAPAEGAGEALANLVAFIRAEQPLTPERAAELGRLLDNADRARSSAPEAREGDQPKLTVWYGEMPESNGRRNWTATIRRVNPTDKWDQGFCFARSEYPDRVRYEADRMRWIIGELAERPNILAYDADLHSGYVAPAAPAAPSADKLRIAVEALERGIKRCKTYEHIQLRGRSEAAKKAGTLRNAMADMTEALAALQPETTK